MAESCRRQRSKRTSRCLRSRPTRSMPKFRRPPAERCSTIKVKEGETVEVGSVLALVGAQGVRQRVLNTQPPKPAAELLCPSNSGSRQPDSRSLAAAGRAKPLLQANGGQNGNTTVDELRRTKSSPLVRNIAKEHGIDITRIPGSGMSGRVTKQDILSFIETRCRTSAAGPACQRALRLCRQRPPRLNAFKSPAAGDRLRRTTASKKCR